MGLRQGLRRECKGFVAAVPTAAAPPPAAAAAITEPATKGESASPLPTATTPLATSACRQPPEDCAGCASAKH